LRRGDLPPPLSYASIASLAALGDPAHVLVDGAPRTGSVLTLSHWPGSPTPAGISHDLSTGIVLNYLERRRLWSKIAGRVTYVTTDHLDQDGLAACYSLVDPAGGQRARAMLLGVAATGDFADCSNRDAARVAFALAALIDPRDPAPSGAGESATVSQRAPVDDETLLDSLPAMLAHPEKTEALFGPEEEMLIRSLEAVASGAVTVSNYPRADLCVVEIPESFQPGVVTRLAHRVALPIHPGAVYRESDAMTVLLAQGRHYHAYLRYESWVSFVSRPLRARPDLRPLGLALSRLERSGISWTAEEVTALEPSLRPGGGAESSLSLREVTEVLCGAR